VLIALFVHLSIYLKKEKIEKANWLKQSERSESERFGSKREEHRKVIRAFLFALRVFPLFASALHLCKALALAASETFFYTQHRPVYWSIKDSKR